MYEYGYQAGFQEYAHGYGYGAPVAGCGVAPVAPARPWGRGFALVIVLFILLVILGAAYVR
ncbi:MAG: YjcZ family sporulation protein [Bacillaceae bacterium]|nr:YjcZ family sporulation protein [Bacillaceae bacterium]